MTGLLTSQRDRNVAAYLIGWLVSASLALAVILVALDTQSERVLDSEGLSWSLSALFGPAVFLGQSKQGWIVVGPDGSLADRERFVSLFSGHIALDFGFIAAYALLGLMIVLFVKRRWWRRLAGVGLTTLVVVDALENFVALAVFEGTADLVPTLVLLTTIKWLLTAALLIIVVIGLAVHAPKCQRRSLRTNPRRVRGARLAGPGVRSWYSGFHYSPASSSSYSV